MTRYRTELVIGLTLAVVTLAAYGLVFENEFVNHDDGLYIVANPHVLGGLTWSGARWAFTTTAASNWHPLTWLSLQADASLSQTLTGRPDDPRVYHLTNLLLHATNTLLLFVALRALTGAVWPSAVVAALFAWHPLHVESVAWAAERKDVLSALFWMLTLLAYAWYVRRPGVGRYLLVALALALGLLAKPMLVTLPCVLLLLDYWPLRRLWPVEKHALRGKVPSGPAPSRVVLEKLPLILLVAASCVVTWFVQRSGGAVRSLERFPLTTRLANVPVAYETYLRKTIVPLDLAVFYDLPREGPPAGEVVGAAVLLLAVTALVVYLRRTRPYLVVGWLWYLGTLVPVIGLVQVGDQALADRYTYLPLIGIFLMLAWGGADLFARRPAARSALVAAAAFTLLACLFLTWHQVPFWRTSLTLWDHAREVTTNNSMAKYHLGSLAELEGDWQTALDLYQQALDIDPLFDFALFRKGRLLLELGRPAQAVPLLHEIVRQEPDSWPARNYLGMALLRSGRLDEAEAQFRRALELNPGDKASATGMAEVRRLREQDNEPQRHRGTEKKIEN